MCLVLNKRSKIRKASRNIRVFKNLLEFRNGNLRSPFRASSWEVGETKRVNSFSNWDNDSFVTSERIMRKSRYRGFGILEVNKGLHAYSSMKAVALFPSSGTSKLFAATIPKGTLYIRGENGEVVSLALTLDKDVTDEYNEYLEQERR